MKPRPNIVLGDWSAYSEKDPRWSNNGTGAGAKYTDLITDLGGFLAWCSRVFGERPPDLKLKFSPYSKVVETVAADIVSFKSMFEDLDIL